MGSDGFFLPDTVHFLGRMTKEFLDRGKMAIPLQFIREYGNELSDSVLLKVRTGKSFEVTLEEAEGRVWVGEGWRKFQHYYSLEVGSLIALEMVGDSVFHVSIFGLDGAEIDHPEEEENGDDSPVENHSEEEENGDDSPVENHPEEEENGDDSPVENADSPAVVPRG